MKNNVILAITSGKGGVGKTNIALNLACLLQKANFSSLLLDFDLGLGNLDVLLGLTPKSTLQEAIDNNFSLTDAIIPLTNKLDFIPAIAGGPEHVEMDDDTIKFMFKKLSPLIANYDFTVIDFGAGLAKPALSLAGLANAIVVVVTPEPTSITDAYALMKVLSARQKASNFHIIVNQAETDEEYELTKTRISAACSHFLGFTPNILGKVSYDTLINEATLKQIPLALHSPDSPAAMDLEKIAQKLTCIKKLINISESIL